MALNCWEQLGCGHGPDENGGGNRVVCPVATEGRHDGINRGRQAGRYCWRVRNTRCGGIVQDTLGQKMDTCSRCEFFRLVKIEEGPSFKI